MWFAPEIGLQATGWELTPNLKSMGQFVGVCMLALAVISWMIPTWAGDNLAKAGMTMVVVSLLPVAMNIFHVVTGALPASGAQIGESVIWIVFAGLFYLFSKK